MPKVAVMTWIAGAFSGRCKRLEKVSTGIGNPHPPKYSTETKSAERIKFM